jgi:hypothetical protein
MADTRNASASQTDGSSSQSTVDRAVDLVLKNTGACRSVDREVRKTWRTLGAAWRACANRVVGTVLVPFGERRTAELGQAFPCADGVVLDLLGSGTSAANALDVQVRCKVDPRKVPDVDLEARRTAGLAQHLLLEVPTTERKVHAADAEAARCHSLR